MGWIARLKGGDNTMSPDQARLKARVASLVAKGRLTSTAAIIFLSNKGIVLLPGGFRHISESEYADQIAEVEEALREEELTTS